MKYFDVSYDAGLGASLAYERVYARGWKIDDEGILVFYDDTGMHVRAFRTWVTVGPA